MFGFIVALTQRARFAVMMCGTNAHGKVGDALRNGGCAHIFDWNTLLPLNDGYGFTEMNGRKGKGNPVTARQIKDAPKCLSPGCPFYFHADPEANGDFEGYCCKACKTGQGAHSPECHKIRYEVPADAEDELAGEEGFTVCHETIELADWRTAPRMLATKCDEVSSWRSLVFGKRLTVCVDRRTGCPRGKALSRLAW